MSDFNAYTTLMQSSQNEYVNSENMDVNGNQMSNNNSNNNIVYNSTPLIVLNNQKQDMALLQNSMMNDGQTYVTIQTQSNIGATDLNGAKLINTPLILQSSQASQYQQQPSTALNVQQNTTQMTSLTPSQLQSLSYLMQTQIQPQFIQTSNGFIQIIPQGFITTQNIQNQGQDQGQQTQISGLPTIGWSLGNISTTNNNLTLDNNQVQPFQMNNLALPQLIPVQHFIQSNNSFFTNQIDNQDQVVSTIVDLNANDKKSINATNKKSSRRKRKQTSKITTESCQLSSPLAHPTSTYEVKREAAESSSSGKIICSGEPTTQYDNKGRPFSFLCTDCPKKFTLNSRLSAHMRCHTGMRPFTCTVCGFSFTQKSYLIRHAAVHKEERPFHCEKCQKSYKHYGSLANHRKLHRKDDKSANGGGVETLVTKAVLEAVKMEPSDNGRSSSISSLVINNCPEFPVINSQVASGGGGGGRGGGGDPMVMMTEEEEEELERNNTFTISSTTIENSNKNGYLSKQFPLSISSSLKINNNTDKSLTINNNNIFYQSQSLQKREEVNYDDDDDGEEEEEGYGDESRDGDMIDLSLNDDEQFSNNQISSASVCLSSQYHL